MTAWFFFFSCLLLTVVALATLWSATQAAVETGPARVKHLSVVGLVIALLISLGFSLPSTLLQVLGLGLALAAVTLALSEPWRNRALCAVQCGFGAAIAAGLPFATL